MCVCSSRDVDVGADRMEEEWSEVEEMEDVVSLFVC